MLLEKNTPEFHSAVRHIATKASDDIYLKLFQNSWFPSGQFLEGMVIDDLETINDQELGDMRPAMRWWLKNKTRKLIFVNLLISRAQLEAHVANSKTLKGESSLMTLFKKIHFINCLLTSVADLEKFNFVTKQSINLEIKGIKRGYLNRWHGVKDQRKKATAFLRILGKNLETGHMILLI